MKIDVCSISLVCLPTIKPFPFISQFLEPDTPYKTLAALLPPLSLLILLFHTKPYILDKDITTRTCLFYCCVWAKEEHTNFFRNMGTPWSRGKPKASPRVTYFLFLKSWFLQTPKIVWGGKKIDYLQEFSILQLKKGLGVTMWCLFFSTKMENRSIVRRWGMELLKRVFFSSKKWRRETEDYRSCSAGSIGRKRGLRPHPTV